MKWNCLPSLTRGVLMCLIVISGCLSSVTLQDSNECSPRCWNPVQLNSGVWGAKIQTGAGNEEVCKALCVNNGTCIGIDWNKTHNGCWFQMMISPISYRLDINHWSLANCTGECVSYCWRAVQGSTLWPNVADENHCKLLCSKTSNCTGVDWDSNCWLIFTGNSPTESTGVRHWDIERNLPTSCQFPSSTVNQTVPSSTAMPSLQSPTKSSEESTTGSSSNMTTGIIVLAVLLGLCILIIIGLVINTTNLRRKLHKESDTKNIKLDDNYEDVQRAGINEGCEAAIYTDLVQ